MILSGGKHYGYYKTTNAIAYIENNLCNEIDTNRIAEIALCPYDKFKRFFSYMTK